MPSIKGHTVLIIGGSSGMGFAAAGLALEHGCAVHIASSNSERVAMAVSRLQTQSPGAPIRGHELDLAAADLEEHLAKLFADIVAGTKSGKLDHIIYTAAERPTPTPLGSITRETIDQAARLGLAPRLLVAKAAVAHLHATPSSSITFTGGHVDTKPMPNFAVACAGAASLRGLTRALALDCAPIRVNGVSSGAVMTEMWGDEASRVERGRLMAEGMLLKKVGAPEDLAEAFLYLMRDTNSTGSFVESNGGSLLR